MMFTCQENESQLMPSQQKEGAPSERKPENGRGVFDDAGSLLAGGRALEEIRQRGKEGRKQEEETTEWRE